ncbi:putative toxin-antitoxin system toxin component, PIN family [Candidatus Woesearchaeota archaeon]|nr:putative toxin-antitoxin system toxin component, PIN family [Candidatus Woesearchaeota archaeon]
MKIVADTNRIIAALVKESTTRSILFDKNFEFITSDYTISEMHEHKDELKAKTNLSDEEFDILLTLIFEHIKIIPESYYKDFMDECKNDISDPDDIPILAVAIAAKANGIWAHDLHFKKQKRVKVFTNMDLLKLSKKNEFD